MIADVPRTMSDAKAMQIIKRLLLYILFCICPICERDIPTDISGQKDIFATVLEKVILLGLLITSRIKRSIIYSLKL